MSQLLDLNIVIQKMRNLILLVAAATCLVMCAGAAEGKITDVNLIAKDDIYQFAFNLQTFDQNGKKVPCDGVLTVDICSFDNYDDVLLTKVFNVSKKDYYKPKPIEIKINGRTLSSAKDNWMWDSEWFNYTEIPRSRTPGYPNYWNVNATFREKNNPEVSIDFLSLSLVDQTAL